MKLRVATRQSALALAQTRWVCARLRESHPALVVEEVSIVTEGDRVLDRSLAAIGGKGLFVSEVEAAIQDGRANFAVHSAKDLPASLAQGLAIVAVPERADPHDVLLTRDGLSLDDLPAGTRTGTSSLRRTCQLQIRRPDLEYAALRGNVDTRLRKLDAGAYGAIVLARAGLIRLGLAGRKHWTIPVEVSIPSAGQGCLAIEAHPDDAEVCAVLACLEDATARIELEAERAFLEKLDGGCHAPIAGHARFDAPNRHLTFEGFVGAPHGTHHVAGGADCYVRASDRDGSVAEARALGAGAAETLLARGAADLMREALAAAERAEHTGNGGGKPKGFG